MSYQSPRSLSTRIASVDLPTGIGRAHQLRRLLEEFELTPLRAALLYGLLGLAALYVSDILLVRYVEDPLLGQIQTVKGAAEVVLTAILLFALTTGSRALLEMETERLERQREELQVLHRVMRHNLRNDLNVVRGYSELIHDRDDHDGHAQWCRKIIESVDGLLHYTEQADRIQRISTDGADRYRRIELAERVPGILRTHDRVTGDVRVESAVPESAVVEANHMLDVAIRELVTNAIVHNDGEPLVSVTVDPEGGPSAATQVIVEDDGPGIHPDTIEVLEQAREDQLLHMNGMGLWLVYWTVTESDGTMSIERPNDGGTRVVLTLPDAVDIPGRSMVEVFGPA